MEFKARTIYRIETNVNLDITGYIKTSDSTCITLGVSYDGESCYQFMVVSWYNVLTIHRENDLERIRKIQQYIGELKGSHEDVD
jgi:hypothetical protein